MHPKKLVIPTIGNQDEADLTYSFPCPPLSLLATYTGNALPVLEWIEKLRMNPNQPALAFTSSHDGIGLLPLKNLSSLV